MAFIGKRSLADRIRFSLVRWSEPSITVDEYKRQLAETISFVKKIFEDGDMPAGTDWLEHQERAHTSGRVMLMSNSLGPIPKAERIQQR